MDMESEILEDVLKKGADLLFGPYSNTTEEDNGPTTEDPFFRDPFFHPSLIKDDEPCKAILHYHVGDSNLRVWDILILLPNIAFLFFLFYRLPSTRLRLRATNSKVFRTLYTIVLTCSLVSSLRCFIAMLIHLANPTHDMANTVIWIIGRFIFLTSELSVALLGLTSGSAERTGHTRRIVFACSVIAFIICTIQAYLEIFQPFYGFQLKDGYKMYGHGGPMFWAVTSFLLILFYSLILCAPFCPTKSLTMLPHPRLFYCYISAQLVTNLLTGLGATLLAMNTHSGLCITNITSYAYFSLLAPLTYFCFLHSWFTTAQPSLLFAYKAQLDEEEEEDGTFPTSSSIQSFQLGTDPPAVPQASFICDPIYNPGLQSPVVTEQKLLV